MTRLPALERRTALAHAALAVMAREGLAAATTRAITAEAGMPLASFHYAVASRDELLRDVVELVVSAEGLAAGQLLSDARTPREAIAAALTGYLEHLRSDPGYEQAMFELTQYALRTPALADLPAHQYARYHALASELLVSGAAALRIEWSIPVSDLARMMVAVTDGLTLTWLADRDDVAAARTVAQASEALASFAREAAHA